MGLKGRWVTPLLALIVATGAFAQPQAPLPKPGPVATPTSVASQPASPATLDRRDLETWLDGFMPYAIQRGDIPGAVVAVVKDGQPILVKGYGLSDTSKRALVTPDTLFRPGSVSKLFTWTAVMQLVAAGKLDLDTDVNTYLDFKIPPRPDGPITLRRLMTHTPGFEEAVQGLISDDPKRLQPLDQTVKTWVPTRIYPAGSTPAYSNYGAALAGYIVERVSGEPFAQYVEHHIFSPLGMASSSFRQPLPANLRPQMSGAYEHGAGKAEGYELINASPAGALASSGADMARFMIAHLQDESGANRLLPQAYAKMMHRTYAPGIGPLNRMALGFYESNMNGRRIVSHGGDTQWFHSDLNLFIDDGVGIYVSVNSPGSQGAAHILRGALLRGFADRYFPGPPDLRRVSPEMAKAHAALMAGTYENSRTSRDNFASIADIIQPTQVAPGPDNTLISSGAVGVNGQPVIWREAEPFVWHDAAGKLTLAATVKDGKVVRFSTDDRSAFMIYQPAPWTRSAGWLVPALGAAAGALALTALLWPVTVLVRWKYGARFALKGWEAHSYRAVRIGAIAALVVPAGWAAVLVFGLLQLDFFGPAAAPWLLILGLLGPVLLLAALAAALWDAWQIWSRRKGWRSWFARLWSVVLVASVAMVCWTAVVFHLYGPTTHY